MHIVPVMPSQATQFRAFLTPEEVRAIKKDAIDRDIDRTEWFTQALRESPSWKRVFKREADK